MMRQDTKLFVSTCAVAVAVSAVIIATNKHRGRDAIRDAAETPMVVRGQVVTAIPPDAAPPVTPVPPADAAGDAPEAPPPVVACWDDYGDRVDAWLRGSDEAGSVVLLDDATECLVMFTRPHPEWRRCSVELLGPMDQVNSTIISTYTQYALQLSVNYLLQGAEVGYTCQ
jgi:hypothetical protein